MNKKRILIAFAAITLIGLGVVYTFYNKIYAPNTLEESSLYIPTGSNFDALVNSISPLIKNKTAFIWVAKKKNYPNSIKPGKYHLTKGMNNNDLVNLLRSGNQSTIKLSFNNQDTLEKLAGRIAEQIEADSMDLLNTFKDKTFLKTNKIKKEEALGMYIPNSYEFYWDTSAEKFKTRMLKEFNSFWTSEKKELAKRQNLNVNQVITLASIIQKETTTISERPKVAGLYLNRLNSNWPLQADPTIIFALKQEKGQDVVIKRVLLKDLEIKSNYNTYTNSGLPPGPISMPDISSINAVLNPENHNYYYMCVDIENLGEHVFAKTLSQHNQNAAKYHSWINKQGITR